MPCTESKPFAAIPSLDRLLQREDVRSEITMHGRDLVTDCLREAVSTLRKHIACDGAQALPADPDSALVEHMCVLIERLLAQSLRPVFNLTGTVLHTNLGRAPLPDIAIEAMVRAAGAANVEFDLLKGKRGERDDHVQAWLCRLTGAEAALVVNNNAAAVLLMLNTLALGREVPVSRGELIEIGGAFRMPDIMARAGCTLVEVGTTNRTHLHDFADAINDNSALLMKVHTSNFVVTGFTASVEESKLAALAHQHDLPFIDDLGSGTLVDMSRYGLPREPTPADALAQGADLVSFSGDKLLGGPQCGIIVGRKSLVDQLRKNPMKRAMRLDKVTLAALEAVLKLYADPERLPQRLPSLRLLTRERTAIASDAHQVIDALQTRLASVAKVEFAECSSQIGSGALPVAALPSAGVAITPLDASGSSLNRLAAAFRALPLPVIGHISDGALVFDCRCLGDLPAFCEQLQHLTL